jgi:hypothetical protein
MHTTSKMSEYDALIETREREFEKLATDASGDPVRLAEVIFELAGDDLPTRLVLGNDAIPRGEDGVRLLESELQISSQRRFRIAFEQSSSD